MVRIIKYVHDDIPVPPEIKKCDRIQYWVWIILCIISTIAFAVFVRIEYWKTLHSEIVLPFLISAVAIITSISVGITLIMSSYLMYAIYKIRKMIKEFNEKSNIDTKIMIVHITG